MSKANNNFKDPNTIAAIEWKLWMKYNDAGIVRFGKKTEQRYGFLTDKDKGHDRLLRRFVYNASHRPYIAIAIMYHVPSNSIKNTYPLDKK
ncbi:MAG TPA: hypothetical protein VGC65_00285 [Bacteroidia bacterium]|jgi:hypothetical protein